MPDYYDEFMDEYVAMAASSESVHFIDTRTWSWMNSWDFFDEDQSHPGPLARIEMGRAVAAIIREFNGLDSTPLGGATLPPPTTRSPVDPGTIVMFKVDDFVSVNGQEDACIASIVNPDDWNGLVTINYFDGTFGEEAHIADLILVEEGGCVGVTIIPDEDQGESENDEGESEIDEEDGDEFEEAGVESED